MRYRYSLIFIGMTSLVYAHDDIETSTGVIDIGATIHVLHLPEAKRCQATIKSPPFMPIPAQLPVHDFVASDDASSVRSLDDGCSESVLAEQHDVGNRVASVQVRGSIIGGAVTIPPDTQGAVGPNHLVTTLNDFITFQTKNGATIRTITMNSFWASLASSFGGVAPDVFDPRIAYDSFNNRWIFSASANDTSAMSSLMLAVSQTSDPTGFWNLYTIRFDSLGQVWADQPLMGYNKNWVTLQANAFDMFGNFIGTRIYAINKANLYAHGPMVFTLFKSNSIGASQMPVQTYDNNVTTQYLIQDWSGNNGGRGFLRLYAITGPVNSPTFSAVSLVVSPAPWASSGPFIREGFAPQKNTSLRIMTNDSRMMNAIFRNGFIWTAQTIFLPATGTPTRSSVQWWQISPTGAVVQRGRIDDPLATATNGRPFYAYPSISVNQNGAALVGYSVFSSASFASAGYSYRLARDVLNTMRTPQIFQVGQAPYVLDYGQGEIRWGDYSNTMVDPANDIDFWTIQEYAAHLSAGVSQWGVAWAKVTPLGI